MMEKTVSQILQEVREKVDAGWTQGLMDFTDRLGQEHHCLIGALEATITPEAPQYSFVIRALLDALPKPSHQVMASARYILMSFNDWSHKEQVLDLIDRALAEVTK